MTPGRWALGALGALGALAAALAAAMGGCAARDTVAAAPTIDRGGYGTAFCRGTGPPILADGTCTGALAQRVFGHAACSCGPLSLQADLVTDAFDSRSGPYAAGGAGGDVGAQGGLDTNGRLDVGGNLTVSGGDLGAGSTLRVNGDLAVGGGLGRPSSAATVTGSARIGGRIDVASLSVGQALTTPPGASLSGAITAGRTATGAVDVPAACPCDAAQAVDVAAIVRQHQASNDDASIGLDPAALSDVTSDVTVSLPCGRFYVDGIQGSGGLTVRATGRAALFVGGNVTLGGALAIELAPGAQLDVFVAGAVNLPSSVRIGDPARPTALRLWLAMSGAVYAPSGAQLAAHLYAPSADLVINVPIDLYGAVTVLRVVNSAPISIHHDLAIHAAGETCGL